MAAFRGSNLLSGVKYLQQSLTHIDSTRSRKGDGMQLEDLTQFLKNHVKDLSSEQLVEHAVFHYGTLRLYDDGWKIKELAEVDDKLLPAVMDVPSLNQFIDDVARGIADNPYLNAVVEELDPSEMNELAGNVSDKEQIVSFITLAWCLEQLCQYLRQEPFTIEVLTEYWKGVREQEGSWRLYNTFEKAKLVTIERGNVKKLAYLRRKQIPGTFGKWFLRINVLEAFLEDLRLGFKWNAISCIPLMVYSNDGRTSISEDGKIVAYSYPLAERWCNLYATWNMGFTSHYENFPYIFIKLLIPQVNLYKENPLEYMGNRSHALYIFLNFVCFNRKDIADGRAKKFQWSSRKLSNHFGAVNRKSALDYMTRLYESNPGFGTKFWLRVQKRLS